jgi:hypothetical protein
MIGGLFKSFKFWGVIAAIGILTTFFMWWSSERYDAGYNASELKWRIAQQQAINDAVAEALDSQRLAHEEAIANLEKETEVIERVRIVEREVPKIVREFVQPECRDLGSDIQRVFNDAIRASSPNLPISEPAAVASDGVQ